MHHNRMTARIMLPTPDGGEVEVEVSYTARFERNPCGKPAERYIAEDDGWIIEDIEQV